MVRATQNILPAILAALIAALSMVSLNCVPSDGEDSTLNSGDPGSDYGGDDDAGDDDDTTADDDTGDDDVTVAVIYGSKPEAVSQFGGILASNGMTSYGVAESQVTAVTLDAADVIIVDRWTQWLAQAPALEVKNSGKPVLALGAGGLHLYDQLGMKSGFRTPTDSFTSKAKSWLRRRRIRSLKSRPISR
ncbi:MAG: hypothetical protein M5R36_03895 [Deltaproteobacteria bacterium]|nr:hypothetical protein [Deltaproteobacteria bacterium]